MNLRVFANFVLVAGILFQLWGISGCMNHGARMGTIESIRANEKAGNRNFLIGTGLVFLAIAMKVSARKDSKSRQDGSDNRSSDSAGAWSCPCGTENTSSSEFCPQCSHSKSDVVWSCTCGHDSLRNAEFCSKCGKKRTALAQDDYRLLQ
jgi:hypothetical protein